MKPLGKNIAPPRFLLFIILFALGVVTLWRAQAMPFAHSALIAFDIAAGVFLLSMWPLLKRATLARMRQHAADNDANRVLVLIITLIVSGVVFGAVVIELMSGTNRSPGSLILVVATLLMCWLFANTVFAFHYAHLYYAADGKPGDRGGLDFPDTKHPDYWDFIYFAYTLGMTFQTSDVEISGQHMRRVATWHSLAAFIFNMGVLAFTINILGSAK